MAETAVVEGIGDLAEELFVKLEENEEQPGWLVKIYGLDGFEWQYFFFDPVEQNADFIRETVRSEFPWGMAAVVFCDKCLKYACAIMDGPKRRKSAAHDGPSDLVQYQCGCGRLYTRSTGYVDLVGDAEVADAKVWHRCDSEHQAPMFISKVERSEITLRCPNCGRKQVQPQTGPGIALWK